MKQARGKGCWSLKHDGWKVHMCKRIYSTNMCLVGDVETKAEWMHSTPRSCQYGPKDANDRHGQDRWSSAVEIEMQPTNPSHEVATKTPSHRGKAWSTPSHPSYSEKDTIPHSLHFPTTPEKKERNKEAGSSHTCSTPIGAIQADGKPKTIHERLPRLVYQAQLVVSILYPLPMSMFWMPPASTGSFGLGIFGLYMMHVMYLERYRCVVPRTVAPQTALLFSK